MLPIYKKAVIIDIEGNSAKQKNELKITQFSAIVLSYGKVIQEINMYNRNVNIISPYVRKLTKIEIGNLKKVGYSEKHLTDEIYALIKDADIIYGYDPSFDKNIIKLMFQKYNMPSIVMNWKDVQLMVKDQLKPEKSSLSIIAPKLGFQESNFHNSLVDCRAILYLINYLSSYVGAR